MYPSNGVWRVPGICRAWGVVFWFPPLPLSPITPSLSTADIGGQGASLKFPSKAGGRGYLSPVSSPRGADGPLVEGGGGGRQHIAPTFQVKNGRTTRKKLQKWIQHPKNRVGGPYGAQRGQNLVWGPGGPEKGHFGQLGGGIFWAQFWAVFGFLAFGAYWRPPKG